MWHNLTKKLLVLAFWKTWLFPPLGTLCAGGAHMAGNATGILGWVSKSFLKGDPVTFSWGRTDSGGNGAGRPKTARPRGLIALLHSRVIPGQTNAHLHHHDTDLHKNFSVGLLMLLNSLCKILDSWLQYFWSYNPPNF